MGIFDKKEKWYYSSDAKIKFWMQCGDEAQILIFTDYVKALENLKELTKRGYAFDFKLIGLYMRDYCKRFTDGIDFSPHSYYEPRMNAWKNSFNVDSTANKFLLYLQRVNHSLYGMPLTIVFDLISEGKINIYDEWLYDETIFSGKASDMVDDNTNSAATDKLIEKVIELGIEIDLGE